MEDIMQSYAAIGVDVGKDEVMVASAQEAFAPRKLDRTRSALSAWLRTLPAGARIGVEATGGYHELVAELAHAMGFVVYVLNPRDVYHYARGLGARGKTDRLDALIIARYVAEHGHQLHPFVPLTAAQKRLRDLQHRRATVVKATGMLRQSLAHMPALQGEAQQLLRRCERLAEQIERDLLHTVASDPAQAALQKRLQTIDGVGPLTSVHCATLLSRVPLPRSDALIAFYGFDPRPDDSGKHRGQRRLSKRGPAEGRRLFYNAAMSATNTDTWRPLYQHLRAKGFSTTEAIVIIARRMLRIAFAMFKNGKDFDPKLVPRPLT
jgi:transposase